MRRQTGDGDREGSLREPCRRRGPTERGQRDRKRKEPAERPMKNRTRDQKEIKESKEQSHTSQDHKRHG